MEHIIKYFPGLDEEQKARFAKLGELYPEWNEKINVISRKDIDNLYVNHILHSLGIVKFVTFEPGTRVIDFGTGGGFPGIPLAMQFPQARFTLCDSVGKKIIVANALVEGLGLRNAVCVNARAESLPDSFDWVVSRAVTSLDNFYPWVKGKYRKGILYLKGGDVQSEIETLCRKFRVPEASVKLWPVSQWLDDDYFSEKFVIEIGKD